MTRWILHADMDAFYASVEQRDNPELRGKPVIVGAHSTRGVVAAASYEARQFGVHSAMPGFRARELCPGGVFLPGRMNVYTEVSAQVRAVFERFTPLVEPLALDEAFLDVTGSLHLYDEPRALALELKRAVKSETRLNVSVGMGPSKLVAKIACTLSKPDGLKIVPLADVQAFLEPLPIRRLFGVGPVTAGKLGQVGVATIGDLARCSLVKLREVLGDRAPEFQARARGEQDSEVVADRGIKSCGEENTFATDILERAEVSAVLTAHAEAVAARLRRAKLRGRTITLKIKLGRALGGRASRNDGERNEPVYPTLTRSRTIEAATTNGKLIRDIALSLWDEANVEEPVRLLGVSLSNLEPATESAQLDLFGASSKPDRLGPTLDKINARFGKDSIHRAVAEPEKTTLSLSKRPS